MYADDLILLSISISDMQELVNMCHNFFNNVGLKINLNKSCCLRVGCRQNAPVANLLVDGTVLQWTDQMDYLGVQLCSSSKFTVNLQKPKQKFFAALNGILSKIQPYASPEVLISLIEAKCVSILLYACECFLWKKSMIDSLEFAYCQIYFKIFHTYDKNVAYHCMYYLGHLPIEYKISKRKTQFLWNLQKTNSDPLSFLVKNDNELDNLLSKFNLKDENWNDQFTLKFKDFLQIV
jgi:hypothetical protein